MGEGTLLVTGREARKLLGGVSRHTLGRWAREWGLRKVGNHFVRLDLERAVEEFARPPQSNGRAA